LAPILCSAPKSADEAGPIAIGDLYDLSGKVVLFLAAPASDWITGQTLVVDGGLLIC